MSPPSHGSVKYSVSPRRTSRSSAKSRLRIHPVPCSLAASSAKKCSRCGWCGSDSIDSVQAQWWRSVSSTAARRGSEGEAASTRTRTCLRAAADLAAITELRKRHKPQATAEIASTCQEFDAADRVERRCPCQYSSAREAQAFAYGGSSSKNVVTSFAPKTRCGDWFLFPAATARGERPWVAGARMGGCYTGVDELGRQTARRALVDKVRPTLRASYPGSLALPHGFTATNRYGALHRTFDVLRKL